MGVVQRFERRLEGMVGDAFARVFGGKVVPQEVAQALQREAEAGVRSLAGGRLLAPNRYTVTLGATDHSRLAGDEQRVIQLFRDCVQEHLAENGWDTYGGVVVHLERSETLHTGQFRTYSTVDPEAARYVPAQPRTAGDSGMSQRSSHYPEDEQRRYYGAYGYDQGQDYEQDYGQQYGYGYGPAQGYDQNYAGAQGGYSYDQGGYGGYSYESYDQDYSQSQSQSQGYWQGYGYDPGYGHGPGAVGAEYDQNYSQQYGYGPGGPGAPGGPGGPGAYAYDPGYGQSSYADYSYEHGAYGGYAPEAGTPGYGPPAAGPAQLVAVLALEDGSGRNYRLNQGSNIIGRGQDAQFRLPDTGVSRRHLEVIWDGHNGTLSDLASTNGTTVNGNPVQTWQLADGDVIRIGHSTLIFRSRA